MGFVPQNDVSVGLGGGFDEFLGVIRGGAGPRGDRGPYQNRRGQDRSSHCLNHLSLLPPWGRTPLAFLICAAATERSSDAGFHCTAGSRGTIAERVEPLAPGHDLKRHAEQDDDRLNNELG